MPRFDVAVIGAGIAGASLAAEISGECSVALIEAESQPGQHSTGRSAAFWSECYGGPFVQPLTSASAQFLRHPPGTFYDRSFLHPRGALTIGQSRDAPSLKRELHRFTQAGVSLMLLDRAELTERIPGLAAQWQVGLYEPGCSDIDVAALHAAYLKCARARRAQLLTNARVHGLARVGTTWRIETSNGAIEAEIVVNAAGAWADEIAVIAGLPPAEIQPYRRTIVQLRTDPPAPHSLPLILDAHGDFYFKPEAGGRLWLSPHDEAPVAACDVRPEEFDIAVAIDRFERVVDWRVERVEHSWAGLRSFAPDRLPVYGFDPREPGFFWCAGQGGFGIQTSPAAAKLSAALLLGTTPDAMVAGIDPTPYSAARLAN